MSLSLLKKSFAVLVVLSLAIALSSCGNSKEKGQPEAPADKGKAAQTQPIKVNVATTSINSAQIPVWVANNKGLFSRYGLDVNLTYINSSSTATQALLAGDVPLVAQGATATVNADLAGGDIVMIAGLMNTMPYELVTNSKIKKGEDLKGQKLGISKAGTSSDLGARLILKKLGLQPEKEVFLAQSGDQGERLAALQGGAIQAALMEMPFTLVANKAGFPTLVNMADLKIPFSYNGIATTKKFLKANPEAAERFLKALIDAIHFVRTNKEETLQVMSKEMKLDDKEALSAMYDAFVGPLFLEYPIIPDEAIKTILDDVGQKNEKAKTANPGDFLDMSILKKIKDSGFIDDIYGKKK